MSVTVDQFIERLVRSSLMSEEEVRAFLDGLPEGQRPREGMALARALADAGKLTLYQAGMVYHGKTKTLIMGNYVLLDRLGQGGMGMVFQAQHQRMDRKVALKILPPSATKTPEMVSRFHREVKVAAQLDHPNIVTAYDADETYGVHYLVMQLVEGGDLASMVKQNGPLPIATAVDCIMQAARGLEYAHSKGVIHRDIKPSNMLMDEMGTVKLLDMGLARINTEAEGTEETQDELTVTGRVMGTAEFMAPEQAHNTRDADERSDIYSLGCTLCYLLTGRPPYRGDSAISKIVAHMNEPIPSLRKRRPGIPKRLDAVFAKMIAKSPDDRQQTMLEVVQDLQRCDRKDEATVPIARPAAVGSEQAQDWLAESPSSAMDDPLAWLEPASSESPADAPSPETADLAETAAYRPVKKKPKLKSRGKKRSTPPPEPPKPTFSKPKLIAGGVAAAVALLLLGSVVLKFKTPAGTLVIEVDQPGAEVSVDDGKYIITAPDDPTPIEIAVDEGKHTLRVTKAGFKTETREFSMESGGKEAVTVKLVPLLASQISTPQPVSPDNNVETDWALEFYGKDQYAWVDGLKYDFRGPFTLECYGNPAAIIPHSTLFRVGAVTVKINGMSLRWELLVYPAPQLQRTGEDGGKVEWTCSGESAPAEVGRNRHYAVQSDGEEVVLFIDGHRIARHSAEFAERDWSTFYMGRSYPPDLKKRQFLGTIDEVRISNIARYTKDFTPQRRFEPDEHTIALYHFDEGEGDVLHDSSGNGHHGKIVGAKWVKADGSPITGRTAELTPSPKQPTTKQPPPLAIAPFDADQAKKHQQAWADYLGVPVEITNSIGMMLVLIPPGEFLMGHPDK